MPSLISLLLGFFSSAGPIASFFFRIGKSLTVTTLILPIQITLIGALVVAKVAFLIALITLLVIIFNRVIAFFDYIDGFLINSDFYLPIKILESIGLMDAFYDVMPFFIIILVSFFTLFLANLVIKSLTMASDEFYKVGMLLNTGIKV